MEWPRLIYHATAGLKSECGKYTYRRCESQEDFDELHKAGWELSPAELKARLEAEEQRRIEAEAAAALKEQRGEPMTAPIEPPASVLPPAASSEPAGKPEPKQSPRKYVRKAARKAA